tara:strand:- start:685 stop:1053 length:369 start_codon:yes stop_codon:yes gene_type:complete
MHYFRNPTRDEARAYYKHWVDNLHSWDVDLAREMVAGEGPQEIVTSTEGTEVPMSERLSRLAAYCEYGPPGSSINDLAKAAYAQLIIKGVPEKVATDSISLGQMRLMHFAKKITSAEIQFDL